MAFCVASTASDTYIKVDTAVVLLGDLRGFMKLYASSMVSQPGLGTMGDWYAGRAQTVEVLDKLKTWL